MKTLKVTATGGISRHNDDDTFVKDGILEALGGILSLTSDTDTGIEFILSGAVDNPGIDITEGWVVIDGEPCYLPAQPYTIGVGEVAWLEKVTTFDPAGLKTLESGGTTDTYEIVTAQVAVGVSLPAGKRELKNVPRLSEIINRAIDINGEFKIKATVNLGTWDMDASADHTVDLEAALGVTIANLVNGTAKIHAENVLIYPDGHVGGTGVAYNLEIGDVSTGALDGWIWNVERTGSLFVRLKRRTGGFFDAAGYSGGANRGVLFVELTIDSKSKV